MKTKLLVSLVALGVSSIAFAHGGMPKAMETNYFDGWYAGAGLGIQHQTADVEKTKSLFSNDVKGNYTTIRGDLGDNALNIGIFGGYGKVLNSDWYLGGELFSRYANANSKLSYEAGTGNVIGSTESVKLSSDYSYGGLLKGGYLITSRAMLYVLAGLEHTNFDVKVNYHPDVDGSQKQGYSFDKSEIALMPGVGIETMLNNNLFLRLQYTYAAYSSFTGNHSTSLQVSDNVKIGTATSTKVEPSRGLASLELGWRF